MKYLTYEDFEKMYRDEKGHIPDFHYIVKKNLGILNHPLADKLMRIAWEDGHSAGYHEVYARAYDLLDLIKFEDTDFKVVNVKELKKEIQFFVDPAGKANDICNCIDRHTIKIEKGEPE